MTRTDAVANVGVHTRRLEKAERELAEHQSSVRKLAKKLCSGDMPLLRKLIHFRKLGVFLKKLRIPGLAVILSFIFFAQTAEAKGFEGAVKNEILDNIPVFGWVKGIGEWLFDKDIIPDLPDEELRRISPPSPDCPGKKPETPGGEP